MWHDGSGTGHGWLADYIAIRDNQTDEEACFFIGEYLNRENGGVKDKHLILNKQTVDNRPCREHRFDGDESTMQQTDMSEDLLAVYKQSFRIEIKTGKEKQAILLNLRCV